MSALVSAIQPTNTGSPHLGNMLGMLLPLRHLAHQKEHREQPLFVSVASLHASTVPYRPDQLQKARRITRATLEAVLGKTRAILFDQADIPSIPRMAQILGHVASLGQLESMTQFKEKGRSDQRGDTGFGLLSYPVLMAADILSLHGRHVPVGSDQLQHLQLARDIAKRCNTRFKTHFPLPQGLLSPAPRIMDLNDPTRKMSKSHPEGAVFLESDMALVHKRFKRATSDSDALPSEIEDLKNRPAAHNLITILAALEEKSPEILCSELGGQGFQALKTRLSEAYEHNILPLRAQTEQALACPVNPENDQATEQVRTRAEKTVNTLYTAMGF